MSSSAVDKGFAKYQIAGSNMREALVYGAEETSGAAGGAETVEEGGEDSWMQELFDRSLCVCVCVCVNAYTYIHQTSPLCIGYPKTST